MRIDDLLITIAYFSIPIQLVFSLWKYPRLTTMPLRVFVLLILFALFIFLCGAGHLMRCLGQNTTAAFQMLNYCTAGVSLTTALYLLPLVPNLMSLLDESMQRLIKLNQETEESRRKLATFMAFLCHEIRNPLFAITCTISFLSDEQDVSESVAKGLVAIQQSSNLMLRLVNDVLDISKLDSGRLELEEREFDLHDLLKHVRHSVQTQLDAKNVALEYEQAASLPRLVRGDSARLLQICYNLLSNAVKFTEKGCVTWTIEAKSEMPCGTSFFTHSSDTTDDTSDFRMRLLDAAEQGQVTAQSSNDLENTVIVEITVKDTGCGIDQERLKRIFQPYAQSKLSDYRKHGGTGKFGFRACDGASLV